MDFEKRLGIALFALRLGIFIVFLVWGLDKILAPAHNSGMIGHYYGVTVTHGMLAAVGIAELIFLGAFVLGAFKTWTYGGVLLFHAVTTIVSAKRLLPADGTLNWSGYALHQLLYFGSLPLLACCIALFLVREKDTFLAPLSHLGRKF